jgi:hypothetical protein
MINCLECEFIDICPKPLFGDDWRPIEPDDCNKKKEFEEKKKDDI